ncbi:MAG: biotin attachment protein, partial [Cellulomonadaceae bacterium]|nr:biotin attachment protein [Cellulomonadaceae bacterium]
MTWRNRFRLLVGLVVVVGVVGVSTYNLNESKGRATSSSAQIAAQSYAVGSPYAGLVVDQLVEVGDPVDTGDALFVIDSATLRQDIATGFVPDSTTASDIDPEGRLIVRATGPGTIDTLTAERGTFVQGSGELASVEKSGTLYVQAEFTLSPTEYARIDDQAVVRIVLPNQQTFVGHVEQIDVQTVAAQAQTVVTVASDELLANDANGLVAAGTPVTAELELRNDSVVTTVADSIKGYLSGIGL